MKGDTFKKIDKVVLSFLFCLSIVTPLIISAVQEDKILSYTENRKLAPLPLFPTSKISLNDYPSKVNEYYSDHFGFRDSLSELYFKLMNKRGGKASFANVIVGKNDWLFLGSIKPGNQRYDDPIGDAMNRNLFTESELEQFAQSIVLIDRWLKNKDIKYIYVIAPNKHTIYSEFLPDYILKQNEKSSTDQLVEYLSAHTEVAVLDLRQALIEKKSKHQLYFKTDTHWNQYGANVAQFEIMKKVESMFPGKIKPFLLDESDFNILPKTDGDLARMATLGNTVEDSPEPIFERDCISVNKAVETNQTELLTMVCEANELNALIFRDSFFTALQPYVSRYFHRSTYIWSKLNHRLLIKYVENENPDIVIDEVIERSFPYVPEIKFK